MRSRLTIAALILTTAAMFARAELVATLRLNVQGVATNASAISGGALDQVGDIAGALDAAVLLAAQEAAGSTGEVVRAYADAAFLPLDGTAVLAQKANRLVSGVDEGVELRFVDDVLTLFTVTENTDTNTVEITAASEDYNGPAVGTELAWDGTIWSAEAGLIWCERDEMGSTIDLFDETGVELRSWRGDSGVFPVTASPNEGDATGTVTLDWKRWETTNTTALTTYAQLTNAIAALNLGTMAEETAADYYTSTQTDSAIAAATPGLFGGQGTTGTVTSTSGDAGRYLKADGTWDSPEGGTGTPEWRILRADAGRGGTIDSTVSINETVFYSTIRAPNGVASGHQWQLLNDGTTLDVVATFVATNYTGATDVTFWNTLFEHDQSGARIFDQQTSTVTVPESGLWAVTNTYTVSTGSELLTYQLRPRRNESTDTHVGDAWTVQTKYRWRE